MSDRIARRAGDDDPSMILNDEELLQVEAMPKFFSCGARVRDLNREEAQILLNGSAASLDSKYPKPWVCQSSSLTVVV